MSVFLEDNVDDLDLQSFEYNRNNSNHEEDYKIREWSISSGYSMIYDPIIDLDIDVLIGEKQILDLLEQKWIDFNSQQYRIQQICDDQLIRFVGLRNYEYYVMLKKVYLKEDLLVREMVEDYVDYKSIQYGDKELNDAIEWSRLNNKIVIVPCNSLEELDELWNNFNMMKMLHQRQSDSASITFFGVTNQQHYNYLRKELMNEDIERTKLEDLENVVESYHISYSNKRRFIDKYIQNEDLSMLEVANIQNSFNESEKSNNEILLMNKKINEILNSKDSSRYVTTTNFILYSDMPFFTPDEMIDFGVFSSVDADNHFGIQADNTVLEDGTSVKEWFNIYKSLYEGYGYDTKNKNIQLSWLNTVRKLYLDFDKIKESGNQNAINSRMQSLLELGWNPYIDFNFNNRSYAVKRIESILKRNSRIYEFVDATILEKDENYPIYESKDNDELKPIYIILQSGIEWHSKVIKAATFSKYTHAAISLDSSMENIYSFGVKQLDRTKGLYDRLGGLTKENIHKYDKGTFVSIYTFFVKNKTYEILKKNLDYFIEHSKETLYAYENLLALVFRIPRTNKKRFICSQFVDNILKLSNIDLSKRNSVFVSPGDIDRLFKKNSKIYLVYDNFSDNFNQKKLRSIVKKIGKNAQPIVEQLKQYVNSLNINESNKNIIINEANRLLEDISPINEARPTPLHFDDDGNLIIRGDIMKTDFDTEYSKSHKILISAEKSNSYETMKYELAKLWMLNSLLEKKLRNYNLSEQDRLKYNNSRARILNDFKKYIDIVMKHEPDFNFSSYYEDSQFNNSSIKVTKNTLKYTAETLKRLLTSDYKNILPFIFINNKNEI